MSMNGTPYWLLVKLYLELKNANLGNRVWQNSNFPGTHRQFKDVSRFSRTTHERRSAGFPRRAWTVSNIKLSGREWIVSIYDESTLHNYEISCNDVCEVPSWPQRARQQTHHSYAAGLLGTEQRREISSRIKGNLLHDLGSAHGQGRPLPSGQLPWNLPVTGLSLSLSLSLDWRRETLESPKYTFPFLLWKISLEQKLKFKINTQNIESRFYQ